MKRHIFIIALLSVLLASCEVDFSPNADYRETPVVYCVLNQDEDTTWVRVERCYLSEGDIYSPGRIADSINYPAGSLDVCLVRHNRAGDRLGDTMRFACTERPRSEGNFASGAQPLYYACVRSTLRAADSSDVFELLVRRASTGQLLARATTKLIATIPGTQYITQPSYKFGFNTRHNNSNSYCEIRWSRIPNVRTYQPYARLFYVVDDDTLYIDTPCPIVKPEGNELELSSWLSRESFLTHLQQNLLQGEGANVKRKYIYMVDIILTAMNEELLAYTNSVNSAAAVGQSQTPYTNIEGGLGVFGARRTGIVRSVRGDESQVENVGLAWLLVNKCGFIYSN